MKRTLLISILMLCATAAPAAAQAPVVDGYGGVAGAVEQVAPSATAAPQSSAPATGREPAADSGEQAVAGDQDSSTSSSSGSATRASSSSQAPAEPVQGLPFTGLDLLIIVAGGIALLSLGVLMRRLTSGAPRPS